jgi:hypothetical protein
MSSTQGSAGQPEKPERIIILGDGSLERMCIFGQEADRARSNIGGQVSGGRRRGYLNPCAREVEVKESAAFWGQILAAHREPPRPNPSWTLYKIRWYTSKWTRILLAPAPSSQKKSGGRGFEASHDETIQEIRQTKTKR